MQTSLLKTSHEDLFLEIGYLLVLHFYEGYVPLRVTDKEWSNLEPWSFGTVAALGNLTTYDEVQDSQSRHYLEPHTENLIYHTFWGVTPTMARIYEQYPPREDIASMLSVPRSETGAVGFIDGNKSPFYGPLSKATELFTVKEKYPQFQAYNPLNDSMYNVMLAFDQRQYAYQIVTDRQLVKDMLVGTRTVKKYTMGTAYPRPQTMPDWLKKAVGGDLLTYTNAVMGGKA
jgi:hypothetical protein